MALALLPEIDYQRLFKKLMVALYIMHDCACCLKQAVTAIDHFGVVVRKGACREGEYRPGRCGWTSDMIAAPYLDPCQRQYKGNQSKRHRECTIFD